MVCVGVAMWRLLTFGLLACVPQQAPGWWWTAVENKTEIFEEFAEPPRRYAGWLYNQSERWGFRFPETWGNLPTSWDSWFWTALDLVFGSLGWLIFGKSWSQVRLGVSLLARLSLVFGICILVHYFFALCWPILSLMLGIVVTIVWVIRTLVKLCGRIVFTVQKMCGRVPEAADAQFFGPGTGETPETSELRKLKRTGDSERWVLVRRSGATLLFKVTEASSIKSTGLYLSFDPETLRGDDHLVATLKGYDKIHVCRNETCSEEGQHFKEYAIVKPFNAERYQLAAASSEAQKAGMQLCGWFGKGAAKVVKRAKDFASESESEQVGCDAGLIWWEESTGRRCLHDATCTDTGCTEAVVLVGDKPVSHGKCHLCPKHHAEYLKGRFQLKCSVVTCNRYGQPADGGLRFCEDHVPVCPPPEPSARRSSRSRSRSRPRPEVGFEEEPEVAPDEGLRRRLPLPDEVEADGLLSEVREEPRSSSTRRRKRAPEGSPGNTPRSGVQRSLARLGLVNSPDKREVQTLLEEYMEQLIDGQELNLDEEDIRSQMAASYGMNLKEFTKRLYEQATEEQQKGTKGLTKFLAKWRKQVAADAPPSSATSSWGFPTPPASEGENRGDGTFSSPGEKQTSQASTPVKPTTRRAKSPGFVMVPPPGIYGRDERKAGTGGGTEEAPITEIAKAIQQQTTELAMLVKSQNETAAATGGTMKALGRTSEELVFLLRACGQYTVEVGAGEYGANLANALLTAQAGASTRLRSAGFRQKVTPRLAIGLAGPHWGTQERYALSASDFLPYTDAELDQYAVDCRAGKPQSDQRPQNPTRFEEWQARAQRQNAIWTLVYGKEWAGVRSHALELLGTWHVQSPHRWPLQVVSEIWEEIHWRFIEELKTELRKIKNMAGRETMSLQDLKFYSLMPDDTGSAPLQLPNTFDLEHPDGWFMQEVLPRINRRQERLLWKMTWEGTGKTRGSGQPAGGAESGHAGGDDKTSRTLLGPKLTPEETARAKDRAPVDKEGKLLCWGYITHAGCNLGNCQRAHEHLRGTFEALDPAVRMQLLRRGGLKRMKAESKESATEKIKELRSQVAKDKDAKAKEGQDRRRAGTGSGKKPEEKPEEATAEPSGRAGGVTWAPPQEMTHIDYTAQEKEFENLVSGPDHGRFRHIAKDALKNEGREGESAPESAKELIKEAQRLATGPVLGALQDASDDLYAWASTRVANDPKLTLVELLDDMVQYGLGDLAAEASAILEKHADPKAGNSRRCQVGATVWDDEGPGRAQVTIDNKAWAMYDYREEIMMTEELAGLVGVVQPEVEKRQCVTKVIAAGILHAQTGRLPSMTEVEQLGQMLRLEQARQAAEAEMIMGHPEPKVSAIEQELRMYSHDILKAHHDKDYRAVAVYPIEQLGTMRMVVLRVDYKGDVLPEIVMGGQWHAGQPTIWALIWKGHMTLLVPPGDAEAKALVNHSEVYTTPTMGFHYFWHQRHDQPRVAPGTLACRHCKPPKKAGQMDMDHYVRKTSCLAAVAYCPAGGRTAPYAVQPAKTNGGPTGLVLQEFFAGAGVITAGWQQQGEVALEGVELYQDPHRQRGRRAAHDLSQPAVQEQYMARLHADEFNVEWIACPCTSFCDWGLQNGGTRTFQNPLGAPTAKEAIGNTLSLYGARLFEAALQRGHFPIAESSGVSGRYPKQWNLPAWQKILQRPDVDFLEIDMCAYGLGPVDAEGRPEYYRHRTGLAFPKHAGFRAALHRLCPGVSSLHKHIPLQGCRPGTDVTRCTEAGVYAPCFVQAVVQALMQFVVVGGGQASLSLSQPQLRAGGSSPEQERGRSRSRGRAEVGAQDEAEQEETQMQSTEQEEEQEETQMQSTEQEEEQEEEAVEDLEEGEESEGPSLAPSAAESVRRWVDETMRRLTAESDDEHGQGEEDPPGREEAEDADPCQGEEEPPGSEEEDQGHGEEEPPDSPLRGVWAGARLEGVVNEEEDAQLIEGGAQDAEGEEEDREDEGDSPIEPAVDEIGGDQWRVDADRGMLWIEHNVPRCHLVSPGGPGCPFPAARFRSERWTQCHSMDETAQPPVANIEDDWRLHGSCQGPYPMWAGTSVFLFHGFQPPPEGTFPWEEENRDRVHRHGPEPEPSPGEPEGEGDGGDDGPNPEEDSGNGEGNPRQAGHSQWTDFEAEGMDKGIEAAAFNYMTTIDEIVDQEPCTWRRICGAGNLLLGRAGSVEAAAKALWIAREKLKMHNLAGVDDEGLDRLLHPDLLGYLRDIRCQGMPARYDGPRERVKCKPHPRARANMPQVYKQLMKDVAKQRVLVVDANHINLGGAVSSPFEAVPKMLPNRTLSTEVRLVHDQRRINTGTDKELHPPAVQPSHDQIVRRILWLKVQYPGVPVMLAKKDVAGAFRLLWLDPRDVELFGGEVPWQPQYMGNQGGVAEKGDPTDITFLYLVSSFGFSGSPGEWNVWGRATEELHRAHRPGQPRRDGAVHFDGKILVDDMVLVEPCIGLRPWISSEVYEQMVRKLLGDKAVNAIKDAEEGSFGPSQLVWGLNIDACSERMSLPEARVAKGAHLLHSSDFSYGEKTLTLKNLQRFRGIATGWAVIVKGLKNELKAADVFLGGIEGGALIQPGAKVVTSSDEKAAWEDLWALFEDCRWLCARSETWAEKFGGDIRELLDPYERLALPGQLRDGAVFVSSDATLEVIGAIDWTNGLACREELSSLKPWIQQVVDCELKEADGKLAIHIGEMLSFVAFACKVGGSWVGKVVVYGGDNKVVYHWITSRKSGVRAGRLLIRVLNLVEMRFRCKIYGGWWRTFHNEEADAITRLEKLEAEELMKQKGWTEVDIKESIKKALEDTERFGPCFLSWADEEDREERMRLQELRVFRAIHRQPQQVSNLRIEEWAPTSRAVKDFEFYQNADANGPRVLACSIGPDPRGTQVRKFWSYAEQGECEVILVEGPREVDWERLRSLAKKGGWKTWEAEYLTSELGETLVRRRRALFAHRSPKTEEEMEALLARAVTPPSLGSVLRTAQPEDLVQFWKYEPAMGQGNHAMLPVVGAHVWTDQDSERVNVYRLSGPGRWPLKEGLEEIYVLDKKVPAGMVRKLSGQEIWQGQGRPVEEWQELVKQMGEAAASKEGCRATGRRTALCLLVAAAELAEPDSQVVKSGMCYDAEDVRSLSMMLVWLRRWRRGDFGRNLPERKAGGAGGETQKVWLWGEDLWLSALEELTESEKAGGRRKTPSAFKKEAEKVVRLQPGISGDLDVQAQVEEWLEEHMDGDKAVSTKKAYQSAWEKWCDWSKRQGWMTPYLSPREDPVVNENKMLGYLGYLGWLGTSVATLKQAVFAIKDAHKRAGHGDATGKMHRLWIVLTSLERSSIKRPRRLGVTIPMLKWIGDQLCQGAESYGDLKVDCRMLQAALLTAWFFMLRAREYCDSSGVDEEMILRGQDVQLSRREGQGEGEAEELTIQFRKTKADQEAFGTCKTMLATGVQGVCVVEAMKKLAEVTPRRFQGAEAQRPLFRWASGQVLRRLEVQNILQRSARAVGLPAERFQSHSLRIGGASALYQATGEIELVKRTGRWTSSAVHRYLHDSGDVLKGLASKMATVDQHIHYT